MPVVASVLTLLWHFWRCSKQACKRRWKHLYPCYKSRVSSF